MQNWGINLWVGTKELQAECLYKKMVELLNSLTLAAERIGRPQLYQIFCAHVGPCHIPTWTNVA